MLRPKSSQEAFFISGSYLYDRIVPQDHLLRKINQVVDFSFVNDLVKDRYTPDFGRPAEDPEFMLRLCLLQYIYGDSDREVEENARDKLAYKYFLGLAVDEEPPDYTTVSYFRAIRLGEEKFRKVFENIVKQCIDKGLVKGQRQIIDSTHIEADIAMSSLSGLLFMCRRNVMKEVERQDYKVAVKLGARELRFAKEERFIRKDVGLKNEIDKARMLLDGITEGLKQGKLHPTERLVKDLEILEKAVVDREEGAKDRLVSPVDADARAGKKTGKSWAGYKGHVIVEEESEIITAIETTPANKADGNQLRVLLKQQEEAHHLVPRELSGDKAYDSGENLELLDSHGITGNVSLTKKANAAGPDLFTVEDFRYDEQNDTLTCPGDCLAVYHRRATFRTGKTKRNGTVFQYSPQQCNVCNLKSRCHPGHRGRAVYTSYFEPLFRRMRERMESEEGQVAYRQRYKIEHKIADLARYCGMRHSRYRGLDRAKIHTLLAAIASNVKRMARLLWNISESPPQAMVVTC
ncbi:MAG: IS1182 family transposase [Dehalococcoidales bacterium]|nr:IS1182 family transposase [Dehalococcoidales bacterium]